MSQSEFNLLASEFFGEEKVVVKVLQLTLETLETINRRIAQEKEEENPLSLKPTQTITNDDLALWGERVWLKGTKCPGCGQDLHGPFANVDWTIQHGVLRCNECGCEFRYLHYIGDICIRVLELVGIPDKKSQKKMSRKHWYAWKIQER